MNELEAIKRQTELAFIQAFFSYLYSQNLITPTELSAIRLEVQKSHVLVDSKRN